MALQHRFPIKCISKLTKHRKHEGNIRKSEIEIPALIPIWMLLEAPEGSHYRTHATPHFSAGYLQVHDHADLGEGGREATERITLIQIHLSWLLLHFKLCGCPTSCVTTVVITTNGARSIKQEWRVPSHKCAFCLVQLSVRRGGGSSDFLVLKESCKLEFLPPPLIKLVVGVWDTSCLYYVCM